jgi:hypothetical protein
MEQWEYKVTSQENEIETLGSQGWEMVSVIVKNYSGNSPSLLFYFKRKLKQQ